MQTQSVEDTHKTYVLLVSCIWIMPRKYMGRRWGDSSSKTTKMIWFISSVISKRAKQNMRIGIGLISSYEYTVDKIDR